MPVWTVTRWWSRSMPGRTRLAQWMPASDLAAPLGVQAPGVGHGQEPAARLGGTHHAAAAERFERRRDPEGGRRSRQQPGLASGVAQLDVDPIEARQQRQLVERALEGIPTRLCHVQRLAAGREERPVVAAHRHAAGQLAKLLADAAVQAHATRLATFECRPRFAVSTQQRRRLERHWLLAVRRVGRASDSSTSCSSTASR